MKQLGKKNIEYQIGLQQIGILPDIWPIKNFEKKMSVKCYYDNEQELILADIRSDIWYPDN